MRRFALAAGLGLVLGTAGQAEASLMFTAGHSNAAGAINVAINDRTDTITATINGVPVTTFDRDGESFTFAVPIAPIFLSVDSASRDMLEPRGGFSDRLLVAGLVSNFLGVSFASDPATTLQGNHVFSAVTEDGTFQSMFFATATDFLGQTAVVNFSVASDVEAVVPEPSTIVMTASAVPLALGLWLRRRRRATA
jgi:hypothetical protein